MYTFNIFNFRFIIFCVDTIEKTRKISEDLQFSNFPKFPNSASSVLVAQN